MAEYAAGTVAKVRVKSYLGKSEFTAIKGANDGWWGPGLGLDLKPTRDLEIVRTLAVVDPADADVKKFVEAHDTKGQGCYFGGSAIAAQIKAQTRPPRIPEPGKYGVVRDSGGEEWVAIGGHRWTSILGGRNYPWVDIEGPILVRDGVDDDDLDW